ncbi:protein FAM200A-like [Watersipora subatra]|uniref:protein FAM200A-like n=1 Tax=Watersipora subatra TaxID=2589382 RepID=UPI00355C80EA
MKPNQLKQHLNSQHPKYAKKERAFFEAKERQLKRARLDTTGAIHQDTHTALEASYFASYRIAKETTCNTTTAAEIMHVIAEFFEQEELDLGKLVGVCTDGATAIHLTLLNELNRKLQGKDKNVLAAADSISAFKDKLKLWHNRGDEFSKYFPKLDANKETLWDLARDPYKRCVEEVPEELQEEFLELYNDSIMKDEFGDKSVEEFWVAARPMYPNTSYEVLRMFVQFSSTYLCEACFSTLVSVKTKARNKLDIAADLRCALSLALHQTYQS